MHILTRIGNGVIHHSPTILFLTSMGLTIANPIVAAKNATDAANHIFDEELERKERLSTKDKVKLVWKDYIPTVGLTAANLLTIYGMHTVDTRRYLAVVGMYAASKEAYDRYQGKIKEVIGVEQEKDIREKLKEENRKNFMGVNAEKKFRVYEPFSNQTFWTTNEQLLWAELNINKLVQQTGWASLNQFLEMIPGTKCRKDADKIGWAIGTDTWDWNWSFYPGVPWIDVKPRMAEDDNGNTICVLAFGMPPAEPDFDDPDEQVPFEIRFKGEL